MPAGAHPALATAAAAALAVGCVSARVGVGIATTEDAEASVVVSTTIALPIGVAIGGLIAVDHGGAGTATTAASTIDVPVKIETTSDGIRHDATRFLRLGVRLGRRTLRIDGDNPEARIYGAGAAYLFVIDRDTTCTIFGSEDSHAVGVEAWVDLVRGDPVLGRGMATIGVVYQYDATLNITPCD